LVGAFGATTAFFLSYPLGWHISSTIVLVLGTIFVLSYIFSPKYGLFSKRKHAA
jgi:ABC-type Mn2+/Zn2+ transport system permease subunit